MFARFAPVVAGLLTVGAASADDIRGAEKFLCSAVEATLCEVEGHCVSGAPWNWQIPQFLEIDLKKDLISTTAASGESRSTPIRHEERSTGQLFLQGIQMERAFSFVINEQTGVASMAIAAEDLTVTVFAACTPAP